VAPVASDGAIRAIAGVAFLEGCNTMANITAKACSSPQTAEINAHSRAETLMKWVNIGMTEGAVLVVVAALISPEVGFAFVAGALAEGVITYVEYRHAKAAGLASTKPGTES
jgi:hypothetical protein